MIPGTNAPGSGTTPTLIGLGPGEDKLIVIADYGETVNTVAFWADDMGLSGFPNAETLNLTMSYVDVGLIGHRVQTRKGPV